MKGQLQRLGISYAWERELATCLPDYYKWNQWLFLRMFERGLAYRKRSTVNWCSSCQTVLANEQVVDGGCWRCGTRGHDARRSSSGSCGSRTTPTNCSTCDRRLADWPEKVLTMQRNWIGRSEGARVRFPLVDPTGTRRGRRDIEVFTTRIDTIFGATFVLLAPEHELLDALAAESPDPAALRQRSASVPRARTAGAADGRDREGRVRHGPVRGEPVHRASPCPIWVGELRARRVRHRRGHGACPAHDQRDFEFARKYGLPIDASSIQPDGTAWPRRPRR